MVNAERKPRMARAKSPSVVQTSQVNQADAKKVGEAKDKAERNTRRRQLYEQKKKLLAQQPKVFNFVMVSEQQMDLRVEHDKQRAARIAAHRAPGISISSHVSAAKGVSCSCPCSCPHTPAGDMDGQYHDPVTYVSYNPDMHTPLFPISSTSSSTTISSSTTPFYRKRLIHSVLPKAIFCTDHGLEEHIMTWLGQIQAWLVQFDVTGLWDRPNVDNTVLVLQQRAIQFVKQSLSLPSGGYALVIQDNNKYAQMAAGGRYLIGHIDLFLNSQHFSTLFGKEVLVNVLDRVRQFIFSADMITFSIKGEVNRWRDEGPESVERTLVQTLDARLSQSNTEFGAFTRVGRCHRQDVEWLRPGVLLSGDLISYFAQKWNFIYSDSLILKTDFMETRLPYVPPPSYLQQAIRYDGLWGIVKTGVMPWRRILVPVHLRNELHWVLAVIDFENLTISVYDSLQGTYDRNNQKVKPDVKKTKHWGIVKHLIWLVDYLFDTAQATGHGPMQNYWGNWEFHPHALCPWQSNSSDCRVFVLVFVMHILHGGIPSDTVPASFLLTFNQPRELPGVRLHLLQELMHDYDTERNGLPLWREAQTNHRKTLAPVVPLSRREPSSSCPSGIDVIIVSDSEGGKQEDNDGVIEISEDEEELGQKDMDEEELGQKDTMKID